MVIFAFLFVIVLLFVVIYLDDIIEYFQGLIEGKVCPDKYEMSEKRTEEYVKSHLSRTAKKHLEVDDFILALDPNNLTKRELLKYGDKYIDHYTSSYTDYRRYVSYEIIQIGIKWYVIKDFGTAGKMYFPSHEKYFFNKNTDAFDTYDDAEKWVIDDYKEKLEKLKNTIKLRRENTDYYREL